MDIHEAYERLELSLLEVRLEHTIRIRKLMVEWNIISVEIEVASDFLH